MNPLAASELPTWVVFQLLERCNLRCSMCYEWGDRGTFHGLDPASLDVGLVLKAIRDCAQAKPYFELFGGEPLLYPGIWEVLALIAEVGCEVSFSTNGTTVEQQTERLLVAPPSLLWFSIDGPEQVNDRQRGEGVFRRALAGLNRLAAARDTKGLELPRLGVTCVVTPANAAHVEQLFLEELELSKLHAVSVELQSYVTEPQLEAWERQLREEFGVTARSGARGLVRDLADFERIDFEQLSGQLERVGAACRERGVSFFTQPGSVDRSNLEHYFSGRFEKLTDHRERCAVPWVHAEVSARGEVSACHSFYDLPIGNLATHGLKEIWNGVAMQRVRASLRKQLFPICTACCRYYSGAGVRRPSTRNAS